MTPHRLVPVAMAAIALAACQSPVDRLDTTLTGVAAAPPAAETVR